MRQKLFTSLQDIRSSSEEMALRLRAALTNKKYRIIFNRKRWSDELSVLRRAVDDERIDKLISWLSDHLGDKFTPACRSARSFRMKFLRLEEAMLRASSVEEAPAITAEVKRIIHDLGLIWPNKEGEEELLCAQRTFSFYSMFLEHLLKRKQNGDRTCSFLFGELPFAPDFLRGWMVRLHCMAYEWKDWPKNLQGFHASYGSAHFNRMVVERIFYYCEDRAESERRWLKLKGEICCEKV